MVSSAGERRLFGLSPDTNDWNSAGGKGPCADGPGAIAGSGMAPRGAIKVVANAKQRRRCKEEFVADLAYVQAKVISV